MSIAKEKDLNSIAWFENCLVGQIYIEGKVYAVGYDTIMIEDEVSKNVAIEVNRKLREIISQ